MAGKEQNKDHLYSLARVLVRGLCERITSDTQLIVFEDKELEIFLTLDGKGLWHERYGSADYCFGELEGVIAILPVVLKKVFPLESDRDISSYALRVNSYSAEHEDELLQTLNDRLDFLNRQGSLRFL